MLQFYDSKGTGCCFSPDGENLFLWNGKPVAYAVGGVVFSFAGRHLGWYDSGWLYDRADRPALFTPDAFGGPKKPAIKQMGPMPGMPQMLPMKARPAMPPMRPMKTQTWSPAADASYFSQ
jgi:hypothetical protein